MLAIVGLKYLPKFRAEISRPFHQACLKSTPIFEHRDQIQALICGRSLRDLRSRESWRDLGVIHILVVSGGHLSILATLLTSLLFRTGRNTKQERVGFHAVGALLTLFALGSRLQPPVLRALFDWWFGPKLKSVGWHERERPLVSTWLALPFSQSEFDLVALGLSFFASMALVAMRVPLSEAGSPIGKLINSLIRATWMQLAIWWMVLPFLVSIGVPHPVSSLSNLALAPIFGAVLIPAAVFTFVSGFWGGGVYLVEKLFDLVWLVTDQTVQWLARRLPPAAPAAVKWSLPDSNGSIWMFAIFLAGIGCMTLPLIWRSGVDSKKRTARSSSWLQLRSSATEFVWTIISLALALAVFSGLEHS